MRVVVTGASGMLAHALVPKLRQADYEVIGLTRQDLDVTDRAATVETLVRLRPEVVIQCAAYTNVDGAENNEEEAFSVNSDATANVAAACQKLGSLLVYPSTDYVFDGSADRPYLPSHLPAPLNAYGRSKAAGEKAARGAGRALIVRTSWLYGEGGKNFVETICRLGDERDEIGVVDDQVGLPTSTTSLARVIIRLLSLGALGTFHAADGPYPVSWCEFANEIFSVCRSNARALPTSSESYPAVAVRPRYSVLDCAATEDRIGTSMPNRGQALAEYIATLGSA